MLIIQEEYTQNAQVQLINNQIYGHLLNIPKHQDTYDILFRLIHILYNHNLSSDSHKEHLRGSSIEFSLQ